MRGLLLWEGIGRSTSEYRLLSLAASWVFLLSFAGLYAVTKWATSPLSSFLIEHGIPLLLVPAAVLPSFALLRLTYLGFTKKSYAPFFDGWFIHLVILTPYVIVLT